VRDHSESGALTAAADLWASFPVDGGRRPIVLNGPVVRVPGFVSSEAKIAFHRGAIDVADHVPAPAVRSLRRAAPQRRPGGGSALRLSDAKPTESEFDTDRGRARLPGWQCDLSDTLGPVVVLDAAVVDEAWTPTEMPEDYHFMSGGEAVQEDPVTFTYRFTGSPRAYTDYPDVTILETPTAVAVAPRAVERPGTRNRLLYAEQREVRVRLATPLGDRVMVTVIGLPVTVAYPAGHPAGSGGER
jgi:hypothetical protein